MDLLVQGYADSLAETLFARKINLGTTSTSVRVFVKDSDNGQNQCGRLIGILSISRPQFQS